MAIVYSAKSKTFKLSTCNSDYVFRIAGQGRLLHVYYGAPISDAAGLKSQNETFFGVSFSALPEQDPETGSLDIELQEFSGRNTGDMRISSAAVINADGSDAVSSRFKRYRILQGKPRLAGLPSAFEGSSKDVETLQIDLEDPVTKLRFRLLYTVFPETDVIVRSSMVQNPTKHPVCVERIMSAQLDFYGGNYDLINLQGSWSRERTAERSRIRHGIREIRSLRGSSSHANNPAIAIVSPDATEAHGEAYGILLAYSGNFSSQTELDQYDNLRTVIGINPECFRWQLGPGEEFQAPEAILTFSAQGLGGMSRNLHDFFRNNWLSLRWVHAKRPILINNWEATYFDFDDKKILDIARTGAKLGIEMLVLDDGWFGTRNDDHSALGDWFVNKSKLKSISTLAKNINKLGMKFGLWFEPEMISPVSQLHDRHPEWVLHIPGRDASLARYQWVLDMSRKEVVDYLFETISGVLHSANIEYVKWDMNRNLTEVFSAVLPAEKQGEVFHRFVLGTYDLYSRLLKEFPGLLIEGCSGGGGRFDAGILQYSPQIWCSDDTDAIMRLNIQRGTSLFYPASTMGAHVAVCPCHSTGRTVPFTTRGYVALSGTFGYELDLTKLSGEDMETVKTQVRLYHKYHDLVSDGDMYRISPLGQNNDVESWLFVSKNQKRAVLTAVRRGVRVNLPRERIRLAGLNPKQKYRISICGGAESVLYGDSLMNFGIQVPQNMMQDYTSAFITLEAVK